MLWSIAPSIARDCGLEERPMSQEMELRHLELANRHIAEGQQRIAEQRARVAGLKRRGRDTTTSNELLKCFEETLELMMRHRDLILREIKRLV
jgi:hypothetical protein